MSSILIYIQEYSEIACYKAHVILEDNNSLLTYKIIPGHAEGSYGIAVCKLCNFPPSVIEQSEKYIIL